LQVLAGLCDVSGCTPALSITVIVSSCCAFQWSVQVAELEEAAAGANATTPRRAQYDTDYKLQLSQQLLAERQAQWEATASARAARILALERQLEEVCSALQC
jgi:hypothetical protein